MNEQHDRKFLLNKTREQMPEHRYQHTLGVMEEAIRLAERFGANKQQAEIAAIVHDYCKYWSDEKMSQIIRASAEIPDDLLDYDKELWHAPVAAIVARDELGITNQDVLNAVRSHTSGRAGMTLLEKVIWLADYIEPGRHFPGVDEVRELAKQDLDRALLHGLDNTILFLIEKGKKVYPLTLAARNDLLHY